MIRIKCDSKEEHDRAVELIARIEGLRDRKLFCLYHEQTSATQYELIDGNTVAFAREAFKGLGHVGKLTVLVDSPGGDADDTFRLIKTFRKYADDIEVIVASWSKSAATIFALGANKILMGSDAELGPLDAQIRNPKTGKMDSALNAFKSLEYLRQYGIELLDIISVLFQTRAGMDYMYAVEAARPLVSDIVTSLYRQVSPSTLGEARRHLAVGEQYGKMIMERYGYADYPPKKIDSILRTLVWNYPSHGFVIDIDEAKRLGLKVEPLSDDCAELCEELLGTVRGCLGVITETDLPNEVSVSAPAEVQSDGNADVSVTPLPREREVSDDAQVQASGDGHASTTQN